MTFEIFKRNFALTNREMCRQILLDNRKSIRIKKERTALDNLTKIFDTALEIANKKGFQAMTMRDLSNRSGLSMGALYSYFKGKDDLLEMMLGHGRSIISRILEQRINEANGPVERLGVGVRTHLYLSEIMRPWFYFSYMESRNIPKFQRDSNLMGELYTEGLFRKILEEGSRQGVFRNRDFRLTASALKAMLQDWYLKRGKYRSRDLSIDEYADFVIDFALTYTLDTMPDRGEANGNNGSTKGNETGRRARSEQGQGFS
jgi:AcrR family transcriptional regulator